VNSPHGSLEKCGKFWVAVELMILWKSPILAYHLRPTVTQKHELASARKHTTDRLVFQDLLQISFC
jgi:hypothetical protein